MQIIEYNLNPIYQFFEFDDGHQKMSFMLTYIS
jgi:hypothetical protein